MKIVTATCATLLLTGSMLTMAAPYGEKRVERMTEYLQLSDEQASQVKQIFKEQHEQTQERLQAVLSVEQYDKLKERAAERHKHKRCNKDKQQ